MAHRARIVLAFVAVPLLLSILWAFSMMRTPGSGGFWGVRHTLVNYTGLVAIGLMSVGLILAARPVQIEGFLGGLDKYYRLHKWFGIAATIVAIIHWLIEILPRNFVRWGWLEAPVRRPRSGAAVPAGFDPFRDWHGAAVSVAEPALYLMIALVLIALWKRFPYRLFFTTHRLLAVVFLVLVFHATILMGRTYWAAPIGPFLGVLMAAASLAAMASLFHRIGKSRRATGTIEAVEHYRDSNVTEVVVRLTTAWPGHLAGQFAFVDFGDREGAHPFSIASAWRHDGRLRFGIKGLGDYTKALPDRLFPGQTVTIEGPYGRFDFDSGRRQLWIAGGIGIAPFIAGLEWLADEDRPASVDLIYSTRMRDDALLHRLSELVDRTGVRLHLLVTPPDPQLTVPRLEEMVPDWRCADVWFCGPAAFGDAMRGGMIANGLPASRFHQEFFELR